MSTARIHFTVTSRNALTGETGTTDVTTHANTAAGALVSLARTFEQTGLGNLGWTVETVAPRERFYADCNDRVLDRDNRCTLVAGYASPGKAADAARERNAEYLASVGL
jgi:hypothetical protein